LIEHRLLGEGLDRVGVGVELPLDPHDQGLPVRGEVEEEHVGIGDVVAHGRVHHQDRIHPGPGPAHHVLAAHRVPLAHPDLALAFVGHHVPGGLIESEGAPPAWAWKSRRRRSRRSKSASQA